MTACGRNMECVISMNMCVCKEGYILSTDGLFCQRHNGITTTELCGKPDDCDIVPNTYCNILTGKSHHKPHNLKMRYT